jgi:medium-chain acyl-[acyl-carrier-protein] hydrolase
MIVPSGGGAWVTRPRPDPRARIRLFCLPYAGGGPSAFYQWPDRLPEYVEVCSIQLPGRAGRLREAPFVRLAPLVQRLTDAIGVYLDRPFAFFGHSMGALLSFEVSRELRRRGGPMPFQLLVSGYHAPQLPDRAAPLSGLSDAEFVRELHGMNGTPSEILRHSELVRLLLPTLRADFEVCETYVYAAEPALACAIAVFGGASDPRADRAELEAWREQTTGPFEVTILPGDHFFLQSAQPMLLELVSRAFVGRGESAA